MSAKWIRSKQWDDEHLTGGLRPVKWVLRALSSITLAVILLVLVSIYGALASIPIGLIALTPTYLFYGLTMLLAIAVVAAAPTLGTVRLLRASAKTGRGVQWAVGVLMFIGLSVTAVTAWYKFAWPLLHYNPLATGQEWGGVRFFAAFCEEYKAVPMRRLPGMEMSELEFYAWWPLTLVLSLFVVNMMVATLRRIEFKFENLGVLTVHAGIVTVALGSAFYSAAKREGDVLLLAGNPDPATGKITPGPPENTFFDNTRVVLVLDQGRGAEQRLIDDLPRYNDYNLNVVPVAGPAVQGDEGRTLELPISSPPVPTGRTALVDRDVDIRVVGYASYCNLRTAWAPATLAAGETPAPMRSLIPILTDGTTKDLEAVQFVPTNPAQRVRVLGEGAVTMQYTINLPQGRWQELSAPLPDGAQWGLIVEVPGLNLSRIYGVQQGQKITIVAPSVPGGAGSGAPAYELTVQDLLPRPPMPVITKGYEGSSCSVGIIRVEPKAAAPGGAGTAFNRYIYSLYPELNQDLSDERNAQGMPKRSNADDKIRLTLIDASTLSVFVDEQTSADGKVLRRALIRLPGRQPKVVENFADGETLPVAPIFSIKPGPSAAHARQVSVPVPVPELDRDGNNMGKHKKAALAVRLTLMDAQGKPKGEPVTQWLPFVEYFGINPTDATPIALPDGRSVRVAFTRLVHSLPGMFIRLKDFEMFPYPHSTQARDFRSDLLVFRGEDSTKVLQEASFKGYERVIAEAVKQGRLSVTTASTSLNDPLLIGPYEWSDQRGTLANAMGWLFDRLGSSRYKFAQAGWDNRTWTESMAATQRGEMKAPFARFTILGVGNNPGILVIAAGAIMIALGTPWAFYVKPWLIRRKKLKIQAQLAKEGKLPMKKPEGAMVNA